MRWLMLSALAFIALSCASEPMLMREGGLYKLTVAPVGWYVTFPSGTLEVTEFRFKADSTSAYALFSQRKEGDREPIIVSVFIEPTTICNSAECLRMTAWAKLEPTLKNPQEVVLSTIGTAAVVEFVLPEMFNQRNMFAHFYRDGYWIDVHLSQAFSTPEIRTRFVEFVRAVRFVPKTAS